VDPKARRGTEQGTRHLSCFRKIFLRGRELAPLKAVHHAEVFTLSTKEAALYDTEKSVKK
jgi:hypothetical protein